MIFSLKSLYTLLFGNTLYGITTRSGLMGNSQTTRATRVKNNEIKHSSPIQRQSTVSNTEWAKTMKKKNNLAVDFCCCIVFAFHSRLSSRKRDTDHSNETQKHIKTEMILIAVSPKRIHTGTFCMDTSAGVYACVCVCLELYMIQPIMRSALESILSKMNAFLRYSAIPYFFLFCSCSICARMKRTAKTSAAHTIMAAQ